MVNIMKDSHRRIDIAARKQLLEYHLWPERHLMRFVFLWGNGKQAN